MRYIGILLSAVFLAQASLAEERIEGIETTIQSQIDAFLKDDFETAFTYASPNIRALFGSASRFGQMVRNGYPMVWRPSEVTFLDLRRQGPFLFQKVLVKDADGAPHVLEYNMIERDGAWRIDGVQVLAAPSIGA